MAPTSSRVFHEMGRSTIDALTSPHLPPDLRLQHAMPFFRMEHHPQSCLSISVHSRQLVRASGPSQYRSMSIDIRIGVSRWRGQVFIVGFWIIMIEFRNRILLSQLILVSQMMPKECFHLRVERNNSLASQRAESNLFALVIDYSPWLTDI